MRIHSVYGSISGEISSIPQGSFVTIVRLSGCNLNCSYCDALDARNGIGREFEIDKVVGMIRAFDSKNILITGGEPLLQEKELHELIFSLLSSSRKPYNIIIETNGTINPINVGFYSYVDFVMDYKMPISGCFTDMKFENFLQLRNGDFIKFVCGSEYDVNVAIEISKSLIKRGCRAQMAIGQTWDWLQKKDFNLYQYLVDNNCKYFILNYQLHKLLNLE